MPDDVRRTTVGELYVGSEVPTDGHYAVVPWSEYGRLRDELARRDEKIGRLEAMLEVARSECWTTGEDGEP